MADDLPPFECSWGGLKLFANEVTTEGGRTVVVHDLTSGDVHPTHDMGRKARRVKMRLLFDNFVGFPAPVVAANRLEEAVQSGAAAVLSHPMLGRFMARVGDFSQVLDESGVIIADAEFIPEDEAPTVTPTGAGTTGVSGERRVSAAADDLDAALDDLLIPSEIETIMVDDSGVSVTDDCRATVAAWNAGDEAVASRQVLIDVSRLAERIQLAIQIGRFEDELSFWQAYRSSIMLGEAVRVAGQAATSEVASVFTMRILEPCALLPLSARVYGGAQAEDRARQIVSLNDIATPGWLDPGDYVMPARDSVAAAAF